MRRRLLVWLLVWSGTAAFAGERPGGRPGVGVERRVRAVGQRIRTGALGAKLKLDLGRATRRIANERVRLRAFGIEAADPVRLVAKPERRALLASLNREVALLRGARPGTAAYLRREVVRARARAVLGQLREDEANLDNEFGGGVSTPDGVFLELHATKGRRPLTRVLAHELTHAKEMVPSNELVRRTAVEMPDEDIHNLSPAGAARLREWRALNAALGVETGEFEARADAAAAYAAGRLGRPLDNAHVLHSHADPDGRYPHAKMAPANIEGYLKGVEERLTGGRRALTARERAYLDGYRFMLEGSAAHRESLPYAPDEAPGAIGARIRWSATRVAQRILQGARPWYTSPNRAGRMDAFFNLPPRPR